MWYGNRTYCKFSHTDSGVAASSPASTGNTSYQIYQAQGAGFSLIATVSSRVTRFTVSGLSTTTAYQFRVDAVNADSTTPSQTASTTTLVDPPTQPSDLSATVLAGGQVQLDWTDSTGETGYRVYQRNGSASTLIGTVSAGVVTYTVRGLTPGNRYQFYVQAFNAGGVAASGTVTATANDIPTAVQSFTIAVRSNAVTLSWLDSARETSYEIYGDIGGSMALLTTRPANSRSTIVSGLTPSTTYQFYVRAVNALGATVSPTLTVTTDLVPPTNPGPLAVVAASSSQIDLTWSDASYAAGYKIFIRVGNGATTLLATVASGTTTFSATGLLASQRYAFSVQAYNVRGAISTAWQTVTTLAPGATLAPAA